MDNHKPWLRAEIAQWLREGLINDEQANRLYERYPDTAVSRVERPRARSIFASLGAIMLGLGVILLIAYNWEAMHRYSKLGMIFGGFVLSHLAAAALRSQPRLSQALHLLGTMIFGAAVWLIAQIYHVDRHYPDACMFWAFAALLMAWLLPSVGQALLAVVLITCWTLAEAGDFERLHLQGSVLLLVGVLPLAHILRSQALLRMVLLALPLCFLPSAWRVDEDAALFYGLLLGTIYLSAERLAPRLPWTQSVTPLYQSGMALWWATLLLLSFSKLAEVVALPSALAAQPLAQAFTATMVLLLFAAAGVTLFDQRLRPRSLQQWLEYLLLWLPLLAILYSRISSPIPGVLEAVANLALLAYALLFIYRGSEEIRPGSLAAGSILLAVLTLLRFNDLFHSLLARASVFLLLGVLLLLAGLRYSRQQERRKLEKPHAR